MKKEDRESVPFEEHWSGHSLNDRCFPVDPRRQEPAPLHWGSTYKQAETAISEFFQLSGREVIRVFKKGTVFNANEFGEGAILRVIGESYTKPSIDFHGILPQRPCYEQIDNWAVVCGFDHKDQRFLKIVLLAYYDPEKYRSPRGYKAIDNLDSVMRIGEVYHLKEKVKFPPGAVYQKLERISEVQLWGMGKSPRQMLREPGRVETKGVLEPVRI